MLNYIIEIDEILDNVDDPDVWVIYHSEDDLDKYYSLSQLLFDIKFDPN